METTYYVRSGVLGGAAVAELDGAGQRRKGYVYAGGARVAKQWGGLLSWQYEEPVGGGSREGSTQGYLYAGATELDPLGADVGAADPYEADVSAGYVGNYEAAGNGFDQSGGGCMWDGMPVKCSVYGFAINSGYVQDPNRQRGFNNLGRAVPFYRVGNHLDGRLVYRFDNAAEYEDSVDSWRSPLWVRYGDGKAEAGMGGGSFAGPQTPAPSQMSEQDCNDKIASIFGGPGAVAATVHEPSTLLSNVAGKDRSGHLANSGVFHLYTNAQGTEATTGLYRPPGGRLVSGGEYYNGRTYNRDGSIKDEGQLENYFRFSYNSGPLKGVTISFVHVGGTSGGEGGGQRLGSFPSQTNAAGSVRIGNIGGLGGEGYGYNHSHIKVFLNGKLTDPRKVLCK